MQDPRVISFGASNFWYGGFLARALCVVTQGVEEHSTIMRQPQRQIALGTGRKDAAPAWRQNRPLQCLLHGRSGSSNGYLRAGTPLNAQNREAHVAGECRIRGCTISFGFHVDAQRPVQSPPMAGARNVTIPRGFDRGSGRTVPYLHSAWQWASTGPIRSKAMDGRTKKCSGEVAGLA